MRFVDTNILLYAISLDPRDSLKRPIALELLRHSDLAVSVQVLQEFYSQATRVTRPIPMSSKDALAFLQPIVDFQICPITLEIFQSAVAISQRFQLSYWEAAILAAARALGCDAVYSEDLNPRQDYGGLRVINPFATP